MLHDKWLDIPCVIILHSFCFKPGMVSDQKYRRNIFTIIFLFLFHKGISAKGENSYYFLKVLVLGQKLILGKPSNCAKLVRWFPLQHLPLCTYLKIHANEICNIYDKHMHLQPPFSKNLWTGTVRGLKISCVAMLERPIDSGDFSCENRFDEVFMK